MIVLQEKQKQVFQKIQPSHSRASHLSKCLAFMEEILVCPPNKYTMKIGTGLLHEWVPGSDIAGYLVGMWAQSKLE